MKKPSIKTIIVKSLINVLLVLAIILIVITGLNLRSLSIKAIENQALAHAELVKAGLTAHMKAGIMDKRDYYLEEIRQLHAINRLNIIRGDEVIEQFGAGKAWERVVDPVAEQAFSTSKPIFILNEYALQPTIRVIIPYVASQEGALNCLACHHVDEGTVLGAVDIELDVTEYRNQSLMALASLFLISVIAFLLVMVNTSKTIQSYVQVPLEALIEHAKTAYKKHKPVSADLFRTREFTHVANEINLFNSEVIAHQDMLRQKNEELIALNDEIESTLRETVFTMGVIEEQRSKESNNHTKRVCLYSQLLAKLAGLSEKEVDLIAAAAPLHDIGKLGIADEIIFKPDLLNEDERELMENHPRIGYTMLSHSKRDILTAAGVITLQHHEKWDGNGYPQGLKGEEIHIFGRIIALADVFDALFSPRVYKEAWDIDRVTAWISEQRGKHFDPDLVDVFLENIDQFVAIYQQYPTDVETTVW